MQIYLTIGNHRFAGMLRDDIAPKTCSVLRAMLPLKSPVVHARWSGEACWAPLGELDLKLPPENATSFPRPGEVILYPGGISETEILIAYGPVRFGCKAGQLAGNPVITITHDLDQLADVCRDVLHSGKKDLTIECATAASVSP
jgi:hypothetical protein